MKKSNEIFELQVKEFKRMKDPIENDPNRNKYRFYCRAVDIPLGLDNWFQTNPREQKLTTQVATMIRNSLVSDNKSFHLYNRGLLFSAKEVTYDNSAGKATIKFEDPEIHGNIDGGHTFRIIKEAIEIGNIGPNQYVEVEVLTGIENVVELAAARNTSVQVDTKSLEELKGSFEIIKKVLKNEEYLDRIVFKQNENLEKDNTIDIREVIAIFNMFNPLLFKKDTKSHPIVSYNSKETSLKRFINLGSVNEETSLTKRNEIIEQFSEIFPIALKLWEKVENELPIVYNTKGRYGSKKFSKYDNNRDVSFTTFGNVPIKYVVPSGLMYPLVGAFRVLVKLNKDTNKYQWQIDPFKVWENKKRDLVDKVMKACDEQSSNTNAVGRSTTVWDLLFNDLLVYVMQESE